MADKKLVTAALIGVIVGIILAVEVIHIADQRACPAPSCIGGAQVIPVSDRGYADAVLALLADASESIHIATFELKYYENYPDSSANKLVDELIAAHRRGVDVKIIVDEYSKENNAYEKLKSEGINIRYDSKSTTTHAKLVVIDGKIVVLSSTNLSYYGLEKNSETNVIIRDEKTAEYYEIYIANLLANS
ncbi:MAG: phospholipase D-like domain-containing protein [Candidatus Altiarchaeota archaeon]